MQRLNLLRWVSPLRKSKDTGTHLGACTRRNDSLLKHRAPNLWQKVAGLVSLPACLPLTSSRPGLPVCRWGAKPQNLRGQEENKSSDLSHLPAFRVSPPPTTYSPRPPAAYVLSFVQQPGGPPTFPSSLLLQHRFHQPHSLPACPNPTHSSRSTSLMTSSCKLPYLPAGSDFSLLCDP